MKPDRSNYEIWLCDWLDGNLSPEQVKELKAFLDNNPDLADELDWIPRISLTPPESVFKAKNYIKKSFKDITDSQFDHLCIANLENDLSDEQKAELNEIIEKDADKRKTFETIQKLKLKPQQLVFRRKNSVKKLTVTQKTLRLTVAGLIAAAAVALLISIYIFIPGNSVVTVQRSAQVIISDTLPIIIHSPVKPVYKMVASIAGNLNSNPETDFNMDNPASVMSAILPVESAGSEESDSIPVFRKEEPLNSIKIAISYNLADYPGSSADVLQPFYSGNIPPADAEYRSNVDRFLARFFHEHIVKDTTAGERPVESYELAKAGITGLNKLLGWEMALHKNTGTDGEVRSYYFSSKLLKFNAPVKKQADEL